MTGNLDTFALRATQLSRTPLGIIALFIVFVYAMASLVFVRAENLIGWDKTLLVLFLVIFPVLVLASFTWLVGYRTGAVYDPSAFKNEDNFVRVVSSLAAATARQPGATIQPEDIKRVGSIARLVTQNNNLKSTNLERHNPAVLWVDDHPENNVYERDAFQAAGISVSLALNTDDALRQINSRQFAAIISDMGRPEGADAGYALLQRLRELGNDTPYFIYSSSNAPEHKAEAKRRGAQDSTNSPAELYTSVVSSLW